MDEKTALAYAIAKGLAYQENGGKLGAPKAGKTGELKSIYQFTPATWRNYAKQELGDEHAELTADNETAVVTKKVRQWIDEGRDVKQIASMWNAGEGEPDAHTGKFSNGKSSKGVNSKYGVPFDVPTYANKVAEYAKQFYEKDFKPLIGGQEPVAQSTPQVAPKQQQQAMPVQNAAARQPSQQALQGGGLFGDLLRGVSASKQL